MQALNDWLQANWVTILTALAGILATVVVGIWAYFAGIRDKLPYYAIRSINIASDLQNKIPALQMTFDHAPISTFTVTKVAFWNAGRAAVVRTDIPDGDPIRLEVATNGVTILGASVAATNNSASEFIAPVSKDNRSVLL